MRRSLLVLAALALLSAPAWAQAPQLSLEQQVEQTQARLFAAQAEFYLASARKLQADLAAAHKQVAEMQAWWADCIKDATCVSWVTAK